ncbi:MAG: 50S ribosomal protein L19e [Methanomicrobiales archaeon]|jgi:large subunit ribosomal protein L19e|nr:50S ribosomal protein L19e [Methanoregulaceae archaeon]MCC7468197.1 50S ribosomal protein L19e [Burkholderiaceae bacterium]NLH25650.1 50S ribosomal protein L19e [Methanomicrobiales archaeon]HMZ32081.1 50S ribosomal protein L19e [Methanoregulaceae archaeon]HNW80898.1 50S ribosomal protein L19e [Methanoregulaceae archaeon]
MTDIANQRRLAASLLGCGINRVWFDAERIGDIQNAISREDIRGLIGEGVIRARQVQGNSRGRARALMAKRSYGHCKGPGRRKGAAGARNPSKREWIQKIRAIRKTLAELRESGEIEPHLYRTLYRKAAGGQFRNVAHLKAQIGIISGRMK